MLYVYIIYNIYHSTSIAKGIQWQKFLFNITATTLEIERVL